MQENHKQEMIVTLEKYASVCRASSVVIFGHCNAAQEMLDYLQGQKMTVSCYLDNNPQKQGEILDGIPVYPPQYIENFSKENSLVLIITKFYWEMASQLRTLGYEGEIIQVVEFQSFQSFSLEDAVFHQKMKRVEEGYSLLQEVKFLKPQDFLLICPFAALGDVYWAMAYWEAYCSKEGISSCTIAVVGNGCREVASSFGYECILVLEEKKMDALVQAVVFTQEKQALIAHHDRLYTDTSLKVVSLQYMSFTDFYREVIYALPQDTKPASPSVKKTLSQESKRLIEKGNTVIVSPYAHSIVEVPLSFWENLVVEYQEKGFLVLTNVASGQAPLSRTQELSLPLNEMISAVEWAGHFVGMRSGLCDLLHGASCKKTLVFPSCYFSGTNYQVSDFFALEGWEIKVIS